MSRRTDTLGQPITGPMMAPGAPGPPPPPPHHHQMPPITQQAQMQMQAQSQREAYEQAKIRSSRPTDKTMPDGVEEAIIGDGVQRYRDLQDFERRLDASMMRKRLDLVESVNRNPKRYKTMRVWITNTAEDQSWQSSGLNGGDNFDFSSGSEASYRVKIEGRLLDDEDDHANEKAEGNDAADADKMQTDEPWKPKSASSDTRRRFSQFFKAMTVDFERSQLREGTEQSVEWKKPDRAPNSTNLPAAADFDELTFRRNGDENLNITINLVRHEEPERFELSPELADVVDMKYATRAEVVMGLWEYIKFMGLQEEDEKRNFRCDDLLIKVVEHESGYIPGLQDYITRHLQPMPPIQLVYTIRLDEEFHKNPQPTIYDIRVAVDDSLRAELAGFIDNSNPEYASLLRDVASLDKNLAVLIQAIQNSKAKHSFLTSLTDDPANFVSTWLNSQRRDMEIITGEATRRGNPNVYGDEWRNGGKDSVWGTQDARESVLNMLAKQQQQQQQQVVMR